MKKVVLSLLGLAFGISLMAQSNKEEIELYQSAFGMEKKAIVAEFIKLDSVAGVSFWADYDEYETARKIHGQKRIALMIKYSEQYETLNDENTEKLMSEMIDLGNEYNKLIAKYYKSIKKGSGVKAAAQFMQIESYFQSVIRLEIFKSIPLIGEFDKK